MIELNSHFKGKITELQVAEKFLQLGYQVNQPLVSDSRYDFVVDIKGKLLKIQVKTSKISEEQDYFEIATCSSHTNTKGTINHTYSKNEIDYFATIYNDECYIIPVEEGAARAIRLRLKPTKNNQTIGVKFAENYKLKDIFPND